MNPPSEAVLPNRLSRPTFMRSCATIVSTILAISLQVTATAQNSMPPIAPAFEHLRQNRSSTNAPTIFVNTPQSAPPDQQQNKETLQFAPQTAVPADYPPQQQHEATTNFFPPTQAQSGRSLRASASKFDANALGDPLFGKTNFGGGNASPQSYMALTEAGPSGSRTVPAAAFRQWLETTHPQFALNTMRLSKGDVIDVTGHWDDAAKTLDKLGIPCTRISTGQLRDFPLTNAKVLIVNCAGFVNRACLQRIRDFVVGGGYLLTTDWALDNIVQGAFPGYIKYTHKFNRKLNYVAEVTDPDPVLFRNTVSSANWKCDTGCHLLTVEKPELVRTIVKSRALAKEGGEGALAVTFSFGRGQILHLVGHFDNNHGILHDGDSLPDPAPVIGIALRQAIASNFVVAALSGTAVPSPSSSQQGLAR